MSDTYNDIAKSITEITLSVLAVLLPFLAVKIKNKLTKKRKLWFERTHTNQWSRKVFEDIVELRLATKADRSYVLLRSNGTAYYNGLKGDHLTMVYESLEKGISPMLPTAQKVPVHFFEDSVVLCDKQGQLKVVTADIHEGSYFKADLESHGTVVGYCVPIRKCPNSIPEGYVGLCYLDDVDEAHDQPILDEMKSYATMIGLELRVNK